jgi:hypothetical protein
VAELASYEWCLLRVVPRVERGEYVNVGAVVYCRFRETLRAATDLDVARLVTLAPSIDVDTVVRHLAAAVAVCDGTHPALAGLPAGQRFRWLTAPRSTVVQTSSVHTGLSLDPDAELPDLLDRLVRVAPAQ